MGEDAEAPQPSEAQITSRKLPFRDVQFGRIYDRVEPHQLINIAAFGDINLEIDEENLGLERISINNLLKGWEREKEDFTRRCKENGIDIDPFTVYKYYQIQRKVFQILGKPIENAEARSKRLNELGDNVPLSQTKGHAMCSEYATLASYIAQKVGEPAHLIIGTAVNPQDQQQWRNAHAYIWVDGINAVFDSVQAQSEGEYPALMFPTKDATLKTIEDGFDIEAKRLGSSFIAHYGLEAGGFGVRLAHEANQS